MDRQALFQMAERNKTSDRGGRRHPIARWYRLDNAAKIYPVIMRSRHISVFRLSAVLYQEIEPDRLLAALRNTLKRLPFFAVRLRKGVFWYYLESCQLPVTVEEDVINPMRHWSVRDEKGYLFRVRYGQKRIAVEFFHALTDGYGGLVFLKTLTAAYLSLGGSQYRPGHGVLDLNADAQPEEMEDAYRRYSDFRVTRRPAETAAFHLQGTILTGHQLSMITGICSAGQVAEVAKRHQVSITELLTSVYLYQLYRIQQRGGFQIDRPVRISVPINVRRYFPTRTLRNFALYANPGIEPALGDYSFEEILLLVHYFMRYTINQKYLNAMMGANVRPEKNWLLRLAPLKLKTLAMRIVYALVGESRFTGTLSNLGAQTMPEEISGQIDHFEFQLGPSRLNPVNCAVISLNDNLTIAFTSTMQETDIQRAFFQHLVELGLDVTVMSNQIERK